MLKSCKYCGRVHDTHSVCSMKPQRKRYDYSDRAVWKFRHGSVWKNKAVAIKERDHYLCQYCLSQNRLVYVKLEVHHIVPLEEDMSLSLDDDNLITLCRSCHEEAEKESITREELRKLVQKQ